MATRMNMLKLVEEMRGLADFANRRMPVRHQGLLTLPVHLPQKRNAPPRRKRLIPIMMQETVDLPHPVPIHISRPAAPKG